MKKMVKGTLALAAFGAAFAFAPAISASAAATVTLDSATQILTVKASGATEAGISLATVKGDTIKPAADAAWEWHDAAADDDGNFVFDLSALSNVKDNYLQVKTDADDDVVTVKIPAAAKKVAAKYAVADDVPGLTISITDAAGTKTDYKTTVEEDLGKLGELGLEYRNQYGSWAPYDNNDLASYTYRGAALTFRIAAQATDDDAEAEKIGDVEVKVLGTFPSKEGKVSVKKRANGPKAALNYAKAQISIPKGAIYKITPAANAPASEADDEDDSTAGIGAWTTTATAAKETLDVTSEALSKGGVVEVRTKGTGAKISSNIFRIAYEGADTLNIESSGDLEPAEGADTVTLLSTDEETPKTITLKYTTDTAGNGTGFTITNNTADSYQVYFAAPTTGTVATPDSLTKGTAVGAGKSTTLKVAKVADGTTIFIRKVGNAKTFTWLTAYYNCGTIKYPAAPDPTATPEPGDDE